MNYYVVFWLFSVADKLGNALDNISNCLLILTGISMSFWVIGMFKWDGEYNGTESDIKKRWRATFRKAWLTFLPLAIVCWLGAALLPTKKDMLFIIIGGTVTNFVTSNKNAQKLPNDLLVWARMEINNQTAQLAPEVLAKQKKEQYKLDSLKAVNTKVVTAEENPEDLVKQAKAMLEKADAINKALNK